MRYFYNADRSTGVLKGLNAGESYSAKWYNPLTGKFVEISDKITVTGGFRAFCDGLPG